MSVHLPSSGRRSFWPALQIRFNRMNFTVEVLFKEHHTHIGWNAVKSTGRYDVHAFFASQIIVFELHSFHILWFAAHIDMMCSGIDATQMIKWMKKMNEKIREMILKKMKYLICTMLWQLVRHKSGKDRNSSR